MTAHRSMNDLFPSTRDNSQVTDDSTAVQSLLDQAGFVRQAAVGIYSMMPLGFRTLHKIESIIHDEMDHAGVLNVQMPVLHPRPLLERTGRWEKYTRSGVMFSTTEQHQGSVYALAPTAEEIVTATVSAELQSYRQLPLTVHQVGPKFRDELGPRGGLLRAREFRMSDAYSFDADEEGMVQSYDAMVEVYRRIFERVGFTDVLLVQADSGAIGGDGSAEFIVPSSVGDAKVLTCDRCDYAANVEKCDSRYAGPSPAAASDGMQEIPTPGVRTIADVCAMVPGLHPTQVVKTLIFVDRESDFDGLVAVCVRGDLEVSAERLSAQLGHTLEPAEPAEVVHATGVEVGSLGPLGLRGVDRVVFDESVKDLTSFVCGANRPNRHLVGVRPRIDLAEPARYYRVHAAADGHGCPKCSGTLAERRGIEVGHVFQLGHKYSEPLDARYLSAAGERVIPWMGCYGIGTTRLVQAVAESRNDDLGLIWPASIAPYDAYVVVTRPDDAVAARVLDSVLETASASDLSLLVDDRAIRPGRKFADADLIGIPTRITIGRDVADGKFEVRDRATGVTRQVAVGAPAAAWRSLAPEGLQDAA